MICHQKLLMIEFKLLFGSCRCNIVSSIDETKHIWHLMNAPVLAARAQNHHWQLNSSRGTHTHPFWFSISILYIIYISKELTLILNMKTYLKMILSLEYFHPGISTQWKGWEQIQHCLLWPPVTNAFSASTTTLPLSGAPGLWVHCEWNTFSIIFRGYHHTTVWYLSILLYHHKNV